MTDKLIIVVEDDPLLRMNTTVMFEEAGLLVEEFATADEALAFVSVHFDRVAAVFTDAQMPGVVDGLQLARAVVAEWPHVAVIVNSGRIGRLTDFPDSVRFIPKPWRLADVLPAMQDAAYSE